MEFTPCHPQPFTFQQAISFDPEVSADEIGRLQNSISHLKRTQEELQEYAEDPDIAQAIKENNETIASQDERMEAKRIVREDATLVWAQINLKRREEDARLPHTVLYVGELSPPGIHLASPFRLIYLHS
ncbi:hypothetical protein EDD22DRAFT_890261, partial [Suillus occidentalis]